MNSGLPIKVIFFSFLFINFIQQVKTAEIYKSYKRDNNLFFTNFEVLNCDESIFLSLLILLRLEDFIGCIQLINNKEVNINFFDISEFNVN